MVLDIYRLRRASIHMAANSSSLPDGFFSYSEITFYDFVKNFVGDIEAEILQMQCIKNARTLLRINDVFSFFRINSKEIFDLKQRACFINDDMSHIVRPGVRSNMEYFLELVRNYHPLSVSNERPSSSVPTTSKSERKFDAQMSNSTNVFINTNNEYSCKSFLRVFIDNAVNNMNRSSNNYQYDPLVEKFASALYILGGNNAYEFIRMNLPGSLPSNSTLKIFNRNINQSLNECEFRFDSLKKHLSSIDSNFVFAASFVDLRRGALLKRIFSSFSQKTPQV